MASSLSRSTLAVASSIMRMRDLRSIARAMQNSWRWPSEKLAPLSTTMWSSFFSSAVIGPCSPTLSSTAHSSASWYCSSGSRLRRTVPLYMNGSCGMMDIFERKCCTPSVRVSTPSIVTRPPSGSTIRKSASSIDDLPLPVRPTRPTLSPAPMLNETPRSTSGCSGRYRMLSSWTSMAPCVGQSAGMVWSTSGGMSAAASGLASRYCRMRSTLVMLLSLMLAMLVHCFRYRVSSSAYSNARPARLGSICPSMHSAPVPAMMSMPMMSRRIASHDAVSFSDTYPCALISISRSLRDVK
mmetsp:Transcript_58791/g.119695  ORF Transcript_58791/g.119695 Transcript_58791/m.119695 type:complete len:297 (+) Transcript_58791:958-1848(+)